jgi:glycosyltransferase involved in cell wall biosynthesis
MITYKKNYPLAVQVLSELPKRYTLHIAGNIQSSEFMMYLDNIMRHTNTHHVRVDGHVDNLNEWLEDKRCILSTSIAEGCPNSVIEAMAKGIKPVVHCWPGAPEMFGEYVFYTVDQAVDMILGESTPEIYRDIVAEKFGTGCYEQLFKTAQEVNNA